MQKMQSVDKSTSKYVSVNSWDEILEYFKILGNKKKIIII